MDDQHPEFLALQAEFTDCIDSIVLEPKHLHNKFSDPSCLSISTHDFNSVSNNTVVVQKADNTKNRWPMAR